jgi:hypothetical protein
MALPEAPNQLVQRIFLLTAGGIAMVIIASSIVIFSAP